MPRLSDFNPFGSGGGGWDVGNTKAYQTGDVTLTLADAGKTHIFDNPEECDCTLPTGTSLSTVGEKFGFYFQGNVVNLRTSDGVLLSRFTGNAYAAGSGKPATEGCSGCKLDLITVATPGTWQLRLQAGTMTAPKLIKELNLAGATQDASSAWDQNNMGLGANSPGVVPRLSKLSVPKLYPVSESLFLQIVRDTANGTRVRAVATAADGTLTAGSFTTLNAYTASSAQGPTVCVLSQASSYTRILLEYASSATARAGRIIDIADGTTTLNVSSAATWPVLDNAGKTVNDGNSTTSSNSGVSIAGISATQAVRFNCLRNTTDAVDASYATTATASGALGSPSLAYGVPQKISTTNNSYGCFFAVLVDNVASRIFVCGNNDGGATTYFANSNGATDFGAVISVATPATPAKSYIVATTAIPASAAYNGHQPWYNTTDQYIYMRSSVYTQTKRATLVKFQVGAAALSGQAIAGGLEYNANRDGREYATAAILNLGIIYQFYPVDGIDVMTGVKCFTPAYGLLLDNESTSLSLMLAPYVAMGWLWPSKSGATRYRSTDTTFDNAQAYDQYGPDQAAFIKLLTPTTGGGYCAYSQGACFQRSGRYLVAGVLKPTGVGGISNTNGTSLWVLEVPRAA